MDAVLFGKEFNRMCNYFTGSCYGCGVLDIEGNSCFEIFKVHPEEVVEIVEKWSKEHPAKTNADKFKEVFGMTVWESIDKGHGDWSSWWDAPYIAPKEK